MCVHGCFFLLSFTLSISLPLTRSPPSLSVCLSLCLSRASLQASGKSLNLNDESQHGLLMQLLKLSHNCLNYDFIGTSTDESSDDLCTVQIPTSWRSGSQRGSGGQGAADLPRGFWEVVANSAMDSLSSSFLSPSAAFLDSSTLQLFFDLYHSIPPSLSPLVSNDHVYYSSDSNSEGPT